MYCREKHITMYMNIIERFGSISLGNSGEPMQMRAAVEGHHIRCLYASCFPGVSEQTLFVVSTQLAARERLFESVFAKIYSWIYYGKVFLTITDDYCNNYESSQDLRLSYPVQKERCSMRFVKNRRHTSGDCV